MRRRSLAALTIAALVLFFETRAAAQTAPKAAAPVAAPVASMDQPAERRSGVVVGTTVGFGLAGASGYPNNGTRIGDSNYYSKSNIMSGARTSLFVMGALTDYLNFGFWLGGGSSASHDWHSTSFGIGFRLELFPLYAVHPSLRDLGVFTSLGVGSATLTDKQPGEHPNASGSQSFIGAGVFYELRLTKVGGIHIAGGPSLEYDTINSPSIEQHGAVLGIRFVFYGGK
jgi:hypothetical protein